MKSYDFKLGDETVPIDYSLLVIVAAVRNTDPNAWIHLCGECLTLCLDAKWCPCCCATVPWMVQGHFNSVGARRREKLLRRPADTRSHRRLPNNEIADALDAMRAA
jgi:hypothetical protein